MRELKLKKFSRSYTLVIRSQLSGGEKMYQCVAHPVGRSNPTIQTKLVGDISAAIIEITEKLLKMPSQASGESVLGKIKEEYG